MQVLDELSDEARTLALARYRMLAPHLEGERTLHSVALDAGVPFRTAQRWVELYRKSGLAALARKRRSDDGSRKAYSQRILEAIEGLALERPPLPVTAIYRQVKAFADATGEKMPSYPAVHRIVRRIPASLLTLAHQGGRAYSESFDLVHRREAAGPNAIWQADHAQLDILLVRDDGSTARPWLTAVIDDYSRMIAGYYLGFEAPSSLRTSLALRQGIWRKSDPHCSDFTSKHMEQVAIDLKIRLIFSTPGKPQGRGRIERFFRTVNDMFLCDLDGYTGRSRRKPSLTLGELEHLFHTFLWENYHRRPGSDFRLSPKQRWGNGGFLPRMPDSLEQLDLLLIHELRSRRVRSDGVHFCSIRYLSPTLAAYVGEDVTIRFDPRDIGEIRVFYRDRFLCRAISADLAGETIPYRDIARARNRRRRELRAVLQDRQRTVDELLMFRRSLEVKPVPEELNGSSSTPVEPSEPRLKRYYNE